jgi:hypothetical protein
MKTGDSVKITKTNNNPYVFGKKLSMTGLEGRIFDIYRSDKEIYVEIEFDSISIRSMSDDYINSVLGSGTDYSCVDIKIKKVSLSQPRDTPEDVKAARKEMREKYDYISVLDDGTCKIWENSPVVDEESDELRDCIKEEDGLIKLKVSTCRVKSFMIMAAKVMKERKKLEKSKYIKLPVRKRKPKNSKE